MPSTPSLPRGTRPPHRRVGVPGLHAPRILLVSDESEAGLLAAARARSAPDLAFDAVPDMDAAWERLGRGGAEDAPALIVICHPERSGLIPFLRRVRDHRRFRCLPAVLLTEDGRHCPETEGAAVFPVLYLPRPQAPDGRARLMQLLAGLLPGF